MDNMDIDDPVIARIPVRFSDVLGSDLQLHQFPLLTRPLRVPPPAAAAGKRIKARLKPGVKRLEVHVPVDTRAEVWNPDKASELGAAQIEDDKEKNQEAKRVKQRVEDEPRLSEVRMQSEPLAHRGAYMLGIMKDGA
jgi:DNA-directed RNA polymerase-3 subunit RPC5